MNFGDTVFGATPFGDAVTELSPQFALEVTTTDSSTWVDVVMDDTAAAEMPIGSDTVAAYRIQWSARDTNDRSAGLFA